jgi:hypothetical protein
MSVIKLITFIFLLGLIALVKSSTSFETFSVNRKISPEIFFESLNFSREMCLPKNIPSFPDYVFYRGVATFTCNTSFVLQVPPPLSLPLDILKCRYVLFENVTIGTDTGVIPHINSVGYPLMSFNKITWIVKIADGYYNIAALLWSLFFSIIAVWYLNVFYRIGLSAYYFIGRWLKNILTTCFIPITHPIHWLCMRYCMLFSLCALRTVTPRQVVRFLHTTAPSPFEPTRMSFILTECMRESGVPVMNLWALAGYYEDGNCTEINGADISQTEMITLFFRSNRQIALALYSLIESKLDFEKSGVNDCFVTQSNSKFSKVKSTWNYASIVKKNVKEVIVVPSESIMKERILTKEALFARNKFRKLSKLRKKLNKGIKKCVKKEVKAEEIEEVLRSCLNVVCDEMRQCQKIDFSDFVETSSFTDFIKDFITPNLKVVGSAQTEDSISRVAHSIERFSIKGYDVNHHIPLVEDLLATISKHLKSERVIPLILILFICGLCYMGYKYEEYTKICSIVGVIVLMYILYKYGSNSVYLNACLKFFNFYKVELEDVPVELQEDVFREQAFTWKNEYTDGVVASTLMAVFYMIYDKHTHDSTMLPFLKELGDISKIERGMKSSVESIVNVLSKFTTFCNTQYDRFGVLKTESKFPAIDALVDEVGIMLAEFRAMGGNNALLFSKENAQRVLDITKKIDLMYHKELPKDSTFAEARKVLWSLKNSLKEISGKFEAIGRAQDSTRVVPTCIYTFGPPGSGKTFNTKIIFENVLTRTLPKQRLLNFLRNPGNEVFAFRPGGNFDGDGYFNQFAMLIDEFLGATDSAGIDTNFVVSFLQFISDHPVLMQKASIEDKDNWFFLCQFILMTGNRFDFKGVNALYYPKALQRRVKAYLTVPKKEFCTDATKDLQNPEKRVLDLTKVPPLDDEGLPSLEIHDFFLADMFAGNIHSRYTVPPINLSELCDSAVSSVKKNQQEYEDSIRMRVSLRRQALQQRYDENNTPDEERVDFDALLADVREQSFPGFFYGETSWYMRIYNYFVPPEDPAIKNRREVDVIMKALNALEESLKHVDLDPLVKETLLKEGRRELMSKIVEPTVSMENLKPGPFDFLKPHGKDLMDFFKQAETSFMENLEPLMDKCNKWLDSPSNKALLAIGTVTVGFYAVWSLTRVPLFFQSGEIRQKAPKTKPKTEPKFADIGLKTQGIIWSDNTENTASSLWRKNVAKIINIRGIALGYMLGLKGRVALIPKHYHRQIKELLVDMPEFQIALKRYGGSEMKPYIYLSDCKFTDIEGRDLCIIELPKSADEFHDVTSCFVSEKDPILRDRGFKALFIRPLKDDCGYSPIRDSVSYIGPMQVNIAKPGAPIEMQTHSEKGYMLYADTTEGMCGCPGITDDPYHPDSKIFGILTAGNSKTKASYLTAVFREEVEKWTSEEKYFKPPDMNGFVEKSGPLVNFSTIGKCDKPPSDFARNDIKRSVLYEKWGPSKYAPAVLHPKVVLNDDGERELKNPYTMALSKYNRNTAAVNEKLAFAIASAYYAEMVANSAKPEDVRMYTFEEVIVGVPGTHCEPISKKSSCGWDWSYYGLDKKDVFGKEGYDLTTDEALKLRKRVEDMILGFEEGKLPLQPFLDKLKSEKRAREKVKACKTRLFTFPPLEFLIVCKMYIMSFNNWCIDNAVMNGLTIGINPFSSSWSLLAKKMLKFDNKIVSGDFSGWDGCLQMIWFYCLFRIIKLFYVGVYSAKQMKVLDGICEVLVKSIHIWIDEKGSAYYYQWLGCMCSGIFITGLGNSIINQIVLRYAICDIVSGGSAALWPRIPLDFNWIFENVSIVTNGDDNMVAPSNDMLLVNQASLTKALAKIGFTYTDESKTGIIQDFRRLEDVYFLQRTFVWNEKRQRWLSPHKKEPILEAPYWVKIGGLKTDLQQCTRKTIMELSQHGAEDFDAIVPIIVQACKDELDWLPYEIEYEVALTTLLNYDESFYW